MRGRVASVFRTLNVMATLALGGAIAYDFGHRGGATTLQPTTGAVAGQAYTSSPGSDSGTGTPSSGATSGTPTPPSSGSTSGARGTSSGAASGGHIASGGKASSGAPASSGG